MNPETVNELLHWLSINCYAEHYAIGGIKTYEGYGLDFNGRAYVWYYTERGERQDLKFFTTEKEAVAYAFGIIKADPDANKHLIGFVKTEGDLQRLKQELENRGIAYTAYVLLYSNEPPQNRYCVSVYGCDVQQVKDLEKQYGYRRGRA